MLALLFLAQVASATPAATPAPALGTASASVPAGPKTLAELGRERKLVRKGAGTFSVAGTSGMPEVPADAGAAARPGGGGARARVRNAQADVQAARRALDDAATRSGMTSEDAAAARRKLIDAQRELSRLREDAARSGR